MELKTWQEIPIGGIILEPGSSIEYDTGSWRSLCPVRDEEKCTDCMFCWIFCPEGAILVEDGKVTGVDLGHCKGCGICAHECPQEAITMIEETARKGA